MTLTDERLDELAAMEQAATDAPWRSSFSEVITVDADGGVVVATIAEEADCVYADGEFDDAEFDAIKSDAAFIAAARNEFAAMVEQCREANRLKVHELSCEIIRLHFIIADADVLVKNLHYRYRHGHPDGLRLEDALVKLAAKLSEGTKP